MEFKWKIDEMQVLEIFSKSVFFLNAGSKASHLNLFLKGVEQNAS